MLKVGEKMPSFSLTAVIGNGDSANFTTITNNSGGKWRCIFFWPKDFTFVCPTEIVAFDAIQPEFGKRNAEVLGFSVDSEYVHLAWKQHHSKLSHITFPMVSDIKRELSQKLDILDDATGVTFRATFITDPEGIVRHASMNDMKVGRNPSEFLRILDALQTDELCPSNWTPGQDTIK